MATSRSAEAGAWTVRALLYAGRPDPQWAVTDALVRRALELWALLPSVPGPAPVPAAPVLGYRGSVLTAPDGRVWTASGGKVVASSGGVSAETRNDADREFERTLIESAPPGLVPGPPATPFVDPS